MKIGIFDSGLGGLIITHGLIQALPQYDYLYLGDTARVPYGNRSRETVYNFTRQSVDYLIEHGCNLIIIACNTASAKGLRELQQNYIPTRHPGVKVLGVLIPAAEAAAQATKTKQVGVLATRSTVDSSAFSRELHKIDPGLKIALNAAPLLVPLVENDGLKWAGPILDEYLAPLAGVDTLILGCTHYPYMKELIREKVGDKVTVISQDEIVPPKLADYLRHHPEIDRTLAKGGQRQFQVTDLTDDSRRLATELFGEPIKLEHIPPLD